MIIDIHAHAAVAQAIPPSFFSGWMDNLTVRVPGGRRAQLEALFAQINGDVGGDQLVAEMNEAGIDQTVLLAVDFGYAFPEEFPALEPVYSLHRNISRRHPNRFVLFGGVDPRRGREGVELFERAVRDWGFRGLKLYPPCGYSPSDPALFPFYDICQSYGIPVLTHVGPTSSRMSFKHTRPEDVDEAAFAFPQVNFICAHAAVVWYREAALIAEYRPNVFLDVAGFQIESRRGTLVDILAWHRNRGIVHKLLFGTDWPIYRILGNQRHWVDVFADAARGSGLSEAEADMIFRGNAQRVLGGPEI